MEAAMYFKRGRDQNYMMRSEKRPGYPNTPPQPNKPKRDIWYRILTIILLILFCPAGLVLLWRKRLNWPGGVKLLATLLSLVLFFLELGTALWYPFEDESLRSLQHTVSTAIGSPSEWLESISDNWHATDAPASSYEPEGTSQPSADALDRPTPSSDISVSPVGSDTPVPPVTPTPSPTVTPTPSATPTPTPEPTVDPANIPALESASDTLVWYTSNGKWYHKASTCGTMSNASQHTLKSAVASGKTACPYCYPIEAKWAKETGATVYVSTDNYWHTRSGCESNTAEWTPMLLEEARTSSSLQPCDACGARYYVDGVPEVLKNPDAATDPTPEPTLTAAGDTLVWHTSNGKWYHKASTCGTMSNASQHTLKSAVSSGKTACPYCHPIEEKWANETAAAVYVSTDNHWHISTTCSANTSEWTTMLLDEAYVNDSLTPCSSCGATRYANGAAAAESVVSQSIEESDAQNTLNLDDVTNGDTIVYYSNNTSHYHRRDKCASSAITTFIPHTLTEALLEGKLACPVCEPDEPIISSD